MFAYLKGAGASAFVATLGYLLLFINTMDWSQTNTIRMYDVGIVFTIAFSYIGCIFGWLLLKLFINFTITNILVSITSYFILGFIFALIVKSLVGLSLIGIILTISGSVSFYLAQKIHGVILSWITVLIGPISAYIAFCYFSFYT